MKEIKELYEQTKSKIYEINQEREKLYKITDELEKKLEALSDERDNYSTSFVKDYTTRVLEDVDKLLPNVSDDRYNLSLLVRNLCKFYLKGGAKVKLLTTTRNCRWDGKVDYDTSELNYFSYAGLRSGCGCKGHHSYDLQLSVVEMMKYNGCEKCSKRAEAFGKKLVEILQPLVEFTHKYVNTSVKMESDDGGVVLVEAEKVFLTPVVFIQIGDEKVELDRDAGEMECTLNTIGTKKEEINREISRLNWIVAHWDLIKKAVLEYTERVKDFNEVFDSVEQRIRSEFQDYFMLNEISKVKI